MPFQNWSKWKYSVYFTFYTFDILFRQLIRQFVNCLFAALHKFLQKSLFIMSKRRKVGNTCIRDNVHEYFEKVFLTIIDFSSKISKYFEWCNQFLLHFVEMHILNEIIRNLHIKKLEIQWVVVSFAAVLTRHSSNSYLWFHG